MITKVPVQEGGRHPRQAGYSWKGRARLDYVSGQRRGQIHEPMRSISSQGFHLTNQAGVRGISPLHFIVLPRLSSCVVLLQKELHLLASLSQAVSRPLASPTVTRSRPKLPCALTEPNSNSGRSGYVWYGHLLCTVVGTDMPSVPRPNFAPLPILLHMMSNPFLDLIPIFAQPYLYPRPKLLQTTPLAPFLSSSLTLGDPKPSLEL
ncbi:hypothetical protein YC2023_072068 [Brassica napus]